LELVTRLFQVQLEPDAPGGGVQDLVECDVVVPRLQLIMRDDDHAVLCAPGVDFQKVGAGVEPPWVAPVRGYDQHEYIMATVVVTGSTGAIGSATIAVLEKRRAQVVPLSRASVDRSSMASVRVAARELNRTVGHIDALLHIAAVFTPRYQKTTDGLELMLATNHLGPFLLTNLLKDRLTGGGRVITVTAPSTTRVEVERLLDRDRF